MGFRHISQHSFFMADDEQIDLIYYKDLKEIKDPWTWTQGSLLTILFTLPLAI